MQVWSFNQVQQELLWELLYNIKKKKQYFTIWGAFNHLWFYSFSFWWKYFHITFINLHIYIYVCWYFANGLQNETLLSTNWIPGWRAALPTWLWTAQCVGMQAWLSSLAPKAQLSHIVCRCQKGTRSHSIPLTHHTADSYSQHVKRRFSASQCLLYS